MLKKKEALRLFRSEVLPIIRDQYEQDRRIDYPARREAWNNFTDSLHRDRQISDWAADNWTNPF